MDPGCCAECPEGPDNETEPCDVGICFAYNCPAGCFEAEAGDVVGTLTVTDVLTSTVYGPVNIVCSGDDGGYGVFFAYGCVTVTIPAAGLPRDFSVAYTGTFPGAPASPFTVEATSCNSINLEYGEFEDTMDLVIGSFPYCGYYPCGGGVSWEIEQSDDNVTWTPLASGSGTFTCPGPGPGAVLTVTGLPKPTKPLLRWTTITSPPAGWRGFLPGTLEGGGYFLTQGFDSCRPTTLVISGNLTFDDENFLCTPCGPIPKVLCWSGNGGGLVALTYIPPLFPGSARCAGAGEGVNCLQDDYGWLQVSLGEWVGTESFSAQAYVPDDSGCCGLETTATIEAEIRACINFFQGAFHWTVRRAVPSCSFCGDGGGGPQDPDDDRTQDPDPGLTCEGPFLTRNYLRYGGPFNTFSTAIGYGDWHLCDLSDWGPTGQMPSSIIGFKADYPGCDTNPDPPCGAPEEAYTTGQGCFNFL